MVEHWTATLSNPMIFFGAADQSNARTRILQSGLAECGLKVLKCQQDIWTVVGDKSKKRSLIKYGRLCAIWLWTMLTLISKYLRLPVHDVVVVNYPGHLDVLILYPFAKMRGATVVWDAFISAYSTIVEDRQLFSSRHPVGRLAFFVDWLACRAADIIILDTAAHAAYFEQKYSLPVNKVYPIFVGVEETYFPSQPQETQNSQVLFYGKFIPLHGISTIIDAARQLSEEPINWVLIGDGQEAPLIRKNLAAFPIDRLTWIDWVEYERLIDYIHASTVTLGVFSNSEKAANVIPNKVGQCLMAGRPVITRHGPGINELASKLSSGLILIPPADASALANAVREAIRQPVTVDGENLSRYMSKEAVAKSFLRILPQHRRK